MFYLAVAIIWVALLFSYRPPTFIFKKIIVVEHPTTPSQETIVVDEKLEKEMKDLTPPNLDDIVSALNNTIHEIGSED